MVTALMFLVTLVVSVMACISDVRSLRIPNLYSIIVLAAFVLAFAVSPASFYVWWEHVGAMVAMLLITYLMFCFNMLGSGDSKFGSVLALWVGLPGLMVYVFYMALMGGVIGAATLYIRKKKPCANPLKGSWIAQVQEGRNAVPYGVAITFGAWAAFFHTAFFAHRLGELIAIIH